MNVYDIITDYYAAGSSLRDTLVSHSERVAEKAVRAGEKASHLNVDLEFIWEAAMLHDIGIFLTDKPEIGCCGVHPYIHHGRLGRDLLEKRSLSAHARVCERHVGVGITASEARPYDFPPPQRDMSPVSLEEKIICYADKFFSKSPEKGHEEEALEGIIAEIDGYGPGKADIFRQWVEMFG